MTIFVALLWTSSNRSVSFLVAWAPELYAVLQVGSHESMVEGEHHLPRPAGHATCYAAKDTIGFLGNKSTSPAHVPFVSYQYPQVLLCKAALNPFMAQPVLILGVAPSQVQHLAKTPWKERDTRVKKKSHSVKLRIKSQALAPLAPAGVTQLF